MAFEDFLDQQIGEGLGQTEPPSTVVEPPAQSKEPPAAAAEPPPRQEPIDNPVIKPGSDLDNLLDLTKPPLKSHSDITSPPGEKPATKDDLLDKYPDTAPGDKPTPNANKRWAEMRTDLKVRGEQLAQKDTHIAQVEAERDQLKERLASYEGKEAVAKEEWDRITKERETMTQELSFTRVEATPEYKEAVTAPLEQIMGAADHLAKKYEVDAGSLKKALFQPDADKQSEALAVLTEAMNDRDRMNLYKIADAVIGLRQKRDFFKANAKLAMERIEQSRTAQAKQVEEFGAKQWQDASDQAFQFVGKTLWLAQERDNDPDWNNSLGEMKQLVRGVKWDKVPVQMKARILYQAALLPRATAAFDQLYQKHQQLEARIAKLTAATPGAGSGSGGAARGGMSPLEESLMKDLGFVDAVG